MSMKAGENALRTCLAKLDSSAKIDTLLCYKVGNKKCTADYQNNNAVAVLTQKDSKQIRSGVPFVVKCFIHPEIYAGWHSAVGIGSGKYCIETSRLAEFEADTNCDYKAIVTGNKAFTIFLTPYAVFPYFTMEKSRTQGKSPATSQERSGQNISI